MLAKLTDSPIARRDARRDGFTLLELIVVITIIGLLGTLVVTKVGPMLFKAQKGKIEHDLKAIYSAAEQYMIHTNDYPEQIADLVDAKDENGNEIPGSLEEMPMDPWGNEYLYEVQDKPIVRCLGKDQTEGGEGDDEDLQYPKEDTGEF